MLFRIKENYTDTILAGKELCLFLFDTKQNTAEQIQSYTEQY